MSVAYQSIASAVALGDSNLVISKPSGLADGDIMVAFLYRNGDGLGFATLSGWALVEDVNNGSFSTTVLAKKADSGDVAASTFTFSPDSTSGDNSAGSIVRVSGNFTQVVTTYLADAGGVDTSSGGENAVAYTGLTPVAANSLLLMFIGTTNGSNDVDVSGYAVANNNPTWTEIANVNQTYADYGIAHGSYASASATGNFSAVVNFNGSYIGHLVSICESVDAAGTVGFVSSTQTAFTPTGSAGTSGTVGFVSSTQTAFDAPEGRDSSPTQWTNESQVSTTWTNEQQL